MKLAIPDNLLGGTNEAEALFDLALGLFIDRRVTLGRAARIAGMTHQDFLKELGSRKIPIHYDLADAEDDLKTLDSL